MEMKREKGLKNSGCQQQTDTSHPPRIRIRQEFKESDAQTPQNVKFL